MKTPSRGMHARAALVSLVSLVSLSVFAACSSGSDNVTPPITCPDTAPVVHDAIVCFGSTHILAELATTLAEREQGLMGRTSLPDTAGMLFVFGHDQQLSFWMKDTPINLSIAFLDASKTVLNIQEMQAFDTTTQHLSAGNARYALEMKQGWFTAHAIVVGSKALFTLPAGLTIDP